MGLKFNLNFNLKRRFNPKFNLKHGCFLRLKQEKVRQNAAKTQIENVHLKDSNVSPNNHINVDRVNNLDTMEIVVELSPNVALDEVAHVEEIRKKLAADMASALSVSAKISLVSPGSVPRSEGKAKRITDKRKI